jgi:hypothetical protein
MKYPYGSFITKDGDRHRILGAVDEMRFVSSSEKYEGTCDLYSHPTSVTDLELDGWEEEVKAWEPQIGQNVYHPSYLTNVMERIWCDSENDRAIRDFLGVYPTEEACEEAIKNIKEKLKK